VHNLKSVDLDIPHRQLIVFCGVSGSGKTSLALDTLYAEGQRRYIESFSAYTRQFLDRLEKPEAERIDGIPPAIAVVRKGTTRSNRATVGSATDTVDYLRLLFAKIGRVFCQGCGREVRKDTPQSAAEHLGDLPDAVRLMVTFPRTLAPDDDGARVAAELLEDGFVRVVLGTRTIHLSSESPAEMPFSDDTGRPLLVVTDRLTAGSVSHQRLRDSLETAFA
jgi:excinuclease ABC subunit A